MIKKVFTLVFLTAVLLTACGSATTAAPVQEQATSTPTNAAPAATDTPVQEQATAAPTNTAAPATGS